MYIYIYICGCILISIEVVLFSETAEIRHGQSEAAKPLQTILAKHSQKMSAEDKDTFEAPEIWGFQGIRRK